jgi:DNA-binding transcriptional LysR family regulator
MISMIYMRGMHLSAVDLNLLVGLDALLRHRSVSRAAAEVGLSQPAMSRTLGRLRDLLDDPLLVRSGHDMVPTPRALSLSEPLAESLKAVRLTLEPPGEFDPKTARRAFVLGAVDTTQAVVLPRLLEFISSEAPGVEVSTTPIRSTEELFTQLASGDRDLAIGRFEDPPEGIRCEHLYSDRIVCLARRDHPRIRGKLTMKRYLAEAHLSVESISPVERPFTIERLLAKQGLTRRVVCRVENLTMSPFVVAGTDLLCSAPRETIEPFAEGLGLRVLEPPFEAPEFDLHLAWHDRNDRDRGHEWLRNALLDMLEDSRAA